MWGGGVAGQFRLVDSKDMLPGLKRKAGLRTWAPATNPRVVVGPEEGDDEKAPTKEPGDEADNVHAFTYQTYDDYLTNCTKSDMKVLHHRSPFV